MSKINRLVEIEVREHNHTILRKNKAPLTNKYYKKLFNALRLQLIDQ